MITLHPLIRLPRLSKSQFLSILAVTALMLTGILLHADSDGNQSDRGVAGTWISDDGGNLVSFMSDGRSLGSIPINILTGLGPHGEGELAAPAHGEWVRTGNRQFASTSFVQNSHPSVGFTHLIKLTGTWKLNKTSDDLTLTGATITGFLPDGTLQFGPFPGAVTHFKRVIVGQ
jgi:hypothetical protein